MSSPDYGTYKAGERENGCVIYVRDRGRAAHIYCTWGEQKKPQQHLSTKEKERWGKRWTRLESREMKVRKKVRGNIGNNVLSVVEIKFSISSRKHKDTHNCTHLQLSPSGWDCNLAHPFPRLGLSSLLSRQSQPPSGYSSHSLNDVTFEAHSLNCKQISVVETRLTHNRPPTEPSIPFFPLVRFVS